MRHHFGGIQQAWTLCVEVSFYVFLPLWALANPYASRRRSRTGSRSSSAGSSCCTAPASFGAPLFAHYDPSHNNLGLHVLPAFFDEFTLGMGLAVVSVWFVQQGRTWRPFELAGRYPWACWAARRGLLLGRVDPARHPRELQPAVGRAVALMDDLLRADRVLRAAAGHLRSAGPWHGPRLPAQSRRPLRRPRLVRRLPLARVLHRQVLRLDRQQAARSSPARPWSGSSCSSPA